MRELDRGEIVIAPNLYGEGWRPFVIVSNTEYPFYPSGYLGLPVTSQNKPNTYKIAQSDILRKNEALAVKPSYVNPYSPIQINECGKTVLWLDGEFMDRMAALLFKSTRGVE